MSKFSQRRNFGLQKKNNTELPSIHQSAFQLLFSPHWKKMFLPKEWENKVFGNSDQKILTKLFDEVKTK